MSGVRRYLVTGGGGQLATALVDLLDGEVFVAREEALDLRDGPAVAAAVRAFAPDVVLHTAAYTDVDGAERDEATATAVNALGTRHLAAALRGAHTQEHETLSWVHGTVVRTAWLFSATGRNFATTILALARERVTTGSREPLRVVDDQVGSPTYAGHLAAAVVAALDAGLSPGIYHMAGGGACSWCELAREVVALAGLRVTVEPITTAQAARPAPRPAFSALASERGVPQPPCWQDGVAAVMDELFETP